LEESFTIGLRFGERRDFVKDILENLQVDALPRREEPLYLMSIVRLVCVIVLLC